MLLLLSKRDFGSDGVGWSYVTHVDIRSIKEFLFMNLVFCVCDYT